jgi:endonuclease IV
MFFFAILRKARRQKRKKQKNQKNFKKALDNLKKMSYHYRYLIYLNAMKENSA